MREGSDTKRQPIWWSQPGHRLLMLSTASDRDGTHEVRELS